MTDSSSKDAVSKKTLKPTKTALRVERAKISIPHPGLVFGPKHQVLIAKLKRGEIWALNHLSLEAKANLTPLFELWPPAAGTVVKPGKTMAGHITSLMTTLVSEWGYLPTYFDTQYLQKFNAPSAVDAKTTFGIARNMGIPFVPVTSPLFPEEFQKAIRDAASVDKRGVMFRISVGVFNDMNNVPSYLAGLANFLKLKLEQIDILIDLGHRPDVVEVEYLGALCLDKLPYLDSWRTIALASGCFPSSISNEPLGKWFSYKRSDWLGWHAVSTVRESNKQRLAAYGDYGVRCGGPPVFIPNTPAPNLRYSHDQVVWVRKGPKKDGVMKTICEELVKAKFFSGAHFSQGDADIAAKAATTSQKNAQAEQWIQWCTNHHLEKTASQIQNLPWS